METNQLEYKEVIDISKNTCNKFTDVELENGEIITSTYNHPYYARELSYIYANGYRWISDYAVCQDATRGGMLFG